MVDAVPVNPNGEPAAAAPDLLAALDAAGDAGYGSEQDEDEDQEELDDGVEPEQRPHDRPAALERAPTAKGWRDKKLRSFKVNTDGKIELTDECRTYFSGFPQSKQIPFEKRAADWKNGEPAAEPTNNPQPGLSSVWSDLKNKHHKEHEWDFPSKEAILDPLFLFFMFIPLAFWTTVAAETNLYATQVYLKIATTTQGVNPRPWVACTAFAVINFFGILIYRGAQSNGDYNHNECWSQAGFDNTHGLYDAAVAQCMSLVQFEQFRRFLHFSNNQDPDQVNARNPVLLPFDTIKTNAYAAHVLLCAEHNRRGLDGTGETPLTATDDEYLTPMEPKKFYIVLGCKMMDYKGASGYWFEPAANRKKGRARAARERGERSATRGKAKGRGTKKKK